MPRLNAQFVKNHAQPGRYDDGGGLGLRLWIRDDGGKQWVQRFSVNGRRVDRGLGGYPAVSLREARQKAAENHLKAQQGVDPSLRRAETFEELARQRHKDLARGYKNGKHRDQWINTLEKYAFPHIGHMPVDKVELEDIRQLLLKKDFWFEKCETARRVLRRIGVVMEYAVISKYRKDDPTQFLKRYMPKQTKKPKPMRSLPYTEVPAAIKAIRSKGGWPPVCMALEFLALTASRPGEVRLARWDEIDLANEVWRIPAERMKMGREHRVPLSDRCIIILEAAKLFKNDCGLIFPNMRATRKDSGKSMKGSVRELSDMALTKAMRDLELDGVPHGFRSSFRTFCQEQTDVPHEVAEAALAHRIGDKTVAAYARSDYLEKRRPLMQMWANWVGKSTEKSSTVVPIRNRK